MQDEERQNRWKTYNAILEKYTNFCHEELVSEKYPEVLEYLNKRKITNKEIIFFKIGYALTKSYFYEQLKKEEAFHPALPYDNSQDHGPLHTQLVGLLDWRSTLTDD